MVAPQVVVAGHLDIDRIRTDAGVWKNLLGGSALYTALAASIHAPPTGLLATVCPDYPFERFEAAAEGRLRPDLVRVLGNQRRNDMDYVADREGLSDRISAGYSTEKWQNKCNLQGPRHIPTTVGEETKAFHLSPMLPQYARLYTDWADKRNLTVSFDTSEYYAETFPNALRDLIKRVDIVLLSDTESRLLFSEFSQDTRGLVEQICELGPDVVVIRRGKDGCLLADGSSTCVFDALETTVVDPTGAGDSFNGTFITRYPEDGVIDACRHGIATATRCVEASGTKELLEASREEIERLAVDVTFE
jgi:sugar/nucleoside kinase (ribokinase family)